MVAEMSDMHCSSVSQTVFGPDARRLPSMSRTIGLVSRLPAPLRRAIKKVPGSRSAQARLAGIPNGRIPEPGELRPVVYLPTWATWDEMRQRPQYILSAFARAGHDVYFIDPREPRERMADGVHIVPSLKYVPRSYVILYVHFAPLSAMFDSFDDPVIIYDILDNLTIYDADEVGMPEERRVRSHHPAVIERADIVMASAPNLISKYKSERPDILLVENGVEPSRFRANLPRPDVLEQIARPMVGYHGAVARWFDFDLFESVAELLPSYEFVIVGPIDGDAKNRVQGFAELPNVHVIGAVPSDEIPLYVASFDVGIIPFVVDELTRGVSPLKMYEYLAARVPVVSTPLPVCEAHPVVRTASTPGPFASEVQAAMEDRTAAFDEAAATAADAASWDNRISAVRSELGGRHLLTVPS
jgi:glycosyltransferase involved in cell wall biosynthesis